VVVRDDGNTKGRVHEEDSSLHFGSQMAVLEIIFMDHSSVLLPMRQDSCAVPCNVTSLLLRVAQPSKRTSCHLLPTWNRISHTMVMAIPMRHSHMQEYSSGILNPIAIERRDVEEADVDVTTIHHGR
jgi:hypothetical protein